MRKCVGLAPHSARCRKVARIILLTPKAARRDFRRKSHGTAQSRRTRHGPAWVRLRDQLSAGLAAFDQGDPNPGERTSVYENIDPKSGNARKSAGSERTNEDQFG